MSKINQIKDGNGISFKMIVDNKPMEFHLTLLATQNWTDGAYDRYEFGFINAWDALYIRAPYNGGNTGFGVSSYDVRPITEEWHKSYKIITQDLNEINRIALEVEQKEILEKERLEAKTFDSVNKINKLPEAFNTGLKAVDNLCYFRRSKADYRPTYSRNIMGGQITLKAKDVEGKYKFRETMYLNDYVTKDGKFQIKKFTQDAKYFFGSDLVNRFDMKYLFHSLYNRENELKKMISELK